MNATRFRLSWPKNCSTWPGCSSPLRSARPASPYPSPSLRTPPAQDHLLAYLGRDPTWTPFR
ncbi:hypothetical protein [Nonomuraea salmonea]|uniref:hypothetical protein n=1 Tax=Nonomuraea salmonea TaxID=46181 RepID=UPI0031E84E26